ncbi:hypothetical protein GQ43DRAFT_484368 [Delitschia confertaspora ATCC 74209]|uniref:Uncharacterized protein n=1 Tax=Delitschia confertaspora ATCC 74209 TaxID=1513339 RepID=A0A9P4MUK7_9PLEO|nr:hypothetical protein GQ43DRAFT_484368 [Delitschia confertaspora ATCC 74209]
MVGVCKARLLSDSSGQTSCDKPATSLDGRLCGFHSRQCQALYRGYKRRNAQLDSLSASPPAYFAQSKSSLVVQEFNDVDTEAQLRELHGYLFKKYNLLERVVRARRLHHNHFFAIDYDYGHEKYINSLQNERHVIGRALERLGKRAATVMYKNKEWLQWVRKCQEDEEQRRANESQKVKLEALLFKRHQREVERHKRQVQRKEEQKRQEAFLEEVYHQRLLEMSEEAQDSWDPVQDVYEDERENYVDLINYFLMLKDQGDTGPTDISEKPGETPEAMNLDSRQLLGEKPLSKSAKKRTKKANSELKRLSEPQKPYSEGRGPGTIEMETKSQMRERLRKGVKFERPTGWYFAGSEGPMSIDAKVPPIPDDEIEVLLEEVAEIKSLLFCRLLLAHASLFPIALQANSIEEFLDNELVTGENLRDLCLKLERPKLQDVRDACADFVRGEAEEDFEEDQESEEEEDDEDEDRRGEKGMLTFKRRRNDIPEKYQTKREESAMRKRMGRRALTVSDETPTNSGELPNDNQDQPKKMRIKICGRYMYNYPSEKALGRGGWLQFSVIAKDSDLYDAIELCRNWEEFYELSILCVHHYFPASKWTIWVGDLMRQQLLILGFIPYFLSDKASKLTHYFQTGSRGMARRSHQFLEVRNFVCGHVKRNDPVTRRFIEYLTMETYEVIALVRDPKTGRTLIKPPTSELWLVREKSGWGRATKTKYEVLEEVGTSFFERMDAMRKWHFSFVEHYDVYIWDALPGRSYYRLQSKIEETLMRALRVRDQKDCFSLARPIIETITRDPETKRARTIRPGEKVNSIWDDINNSTSGVVKWSPDTGEIDEGTHGIMTSHKYSEADEIEDVYLFPMEAAGKLKNNLYKKHMNAMEKFESKPPIDLRRWVKDADTDDTLSEDEYDTSELEDDDGDSSWETEEDEMEGYGYEMDSASTPPEGDVHAAIELLTNNFKQSLSFNIRPDYFLGILRNQNRSLYSQLPKSIRNSDRDLIGACRFSLMSQSALSDTRHENIEADFLRHIDREKSKIFKECFHKADMEPGAAAKLFELQLMVVRMDFFLMDRITTGPFELLALMDPDAELITEERRIVTDAFMAHAAVSLFFDDAEAFLSSDYGRFFEKDSLLLNQTERAQQIPDRRTRKSNKTMPKELWAEWDKLLKDNGREQGTNAHDIYPREWSVIVRPIIMRLYRSGIITPSYMREFSGIAVASSEPGRREDLYLDYRLHVPHMKPKMALEDPAPYDRDYMLMRARTFAQMNPNARFALLRLWSAPHFYPLLFSYENRILSTFLDDRGRLWEFRFMPKDMPFSEWSVHQQTSSRIKAARHAFKDQAIAATDVIFLMGKDEKDLRMLASAATFVVQTKPWRLEIDFWKSFVNVDLKFMEELHERWFE